VSINLLGKVNEKRIVYITSSHIASDSVRDTGCCDVYRKKKVDGSLEHDMTQLIAPTLAPDKTFVSSVDRKNVEKQS
jgi:hypothetical protein